MGSPFEKTCAVVTAICSILTGRLRCGTPLAWRKAAIGWPSLDSSSGTVVGKRRLVALSRLCLIRADQAYKVNGGIYHQLVRWLSLDAAAVVPERMKANRNDLAEREFKMRALVIGCGKMGVAAAFDLLLNAQTERVGLVGRGAASLQRACDRLADGRVQAYPVAVEDPQLIAIMREFDVGVLALPDRHSSYQAVEAAIVAGLNIVDILEEYHRRPDTSETEGLAVAAGMTLPAYGESLHARARARGVTLLDGFGFAPGISNVTVGNALARLDKPISATARVGGIPNKEAAARHPLGYMVTWSFHHVLREYMIKPLVRRGGLPVLAEARSGRESFRFRDGQRDELLECATTPGMPSLMTTRPDLPEFAEKTVRWPGHFAAIDLLDACGLLSVEPMTTAAGTLVPRDVFAAIVTPRLKPGAQDRDLCVMFNTIVGERAGARVCIEQRMWTEPDAQHDFTAMAKVTGFSAAIGARLLAQGKIRGGPGIVAPEDGVVGDVYPLFLAELARRGIVIQESVQQASAS